MKNPFVSGSGDAGRAASGGSEQAGAGTPANAAMPTKRHIVGGLGDFLVGLRTSSAVRRFDKTMGDRLKYARAEAIAQFANTMPRLPDKAQRSKIEEVFTKLADPDAPFPGSIDAELRSRPLAALANQVGRMNAGGRFFMFEKTAEAARGVIDFYWLCPEKAFCDHVMDLANVHAALSAQIGTLPEGEQAAARELLTQINVDEELGGSALRLPPDTRIWLDARRKQNGT